MKVGFILAGKMTEVCKFCEIPHGKSKGFAHDPGIEAGVPCYEEQLERGLRIKVCRKCHTKLPGHLINIVPGNFGELLETKNLSEFVSRSPRGIVGKGSKAYDTKQILRKCVECSKNPKKNHVGETVRLCLEEEWGKEEIKRHR